MSEEKKLHGLVAYYTSVDGILAAARRVRDAGFTRWDTHTPFPVHGIERAMGIKPTILPWIVLIMGLTGLAFGIVLQWWTNAVAYVFEISGKPDWSLPANIPVVFECVIAFSAFTAFFVMLGLNRLPELSHPLHKLKSFRRVTTDRFALVVETADPRYDQARVREILDGADFEGVEECPVDDSPAQLPRWAHAIGILVACATLVPLALAYKGRYATSEKPRLHVVPDMDWQRKVKAQQGFELFPDGRGMRQPVPGTIAVGGLREDLHYYFGVEPGSILPSEIEEGSDQHPRWAEGFPAAVVVDRALVERGRERFGIYCSACHGYRGDGLGPVSLRAKELDAAQWGWVDPKSLVGANSTALRPRDHAAELANPDSNVGMSNGQMFHVVGHGISTMKGYAAQIPVHDRWAIVAYVRSLQRSQNARRRDAPPGTTFSELPEPVALLQEAAATEDGSDATTDEEER